MLPLIQFVAVLATTIFAGAAIYINLVEHPARLSCSTEIAAAVWAPSYQRATFMQASLAIAGSSAGLAAWMLGAGLMWLVAALSILAVVPVTFTIIFPTNKRLLAPEHDPGSPETRRLLIKWGQLHAIRSALSLIASAIFVWKLGHP
jgi:Domain of unknown function (DUF1772)